LRPCPIFLEYAIDLFAPPGVGPRQPSVSEVGQRPRGATTERQRGSCPLPSVSEVLVPSGSEVLVPSGSEVLVPSGSEGSER